MKGADGTHNPEAARSYDTDPLVHHVATARWFTESTDAQRLVAATADRITIPTLWLLAGEDHIASTPTSRAIFEHAVVTRS